MNEKDYPMRINKYLANQKHATRREADELIKKKKVYINGTLAVLGDKVNETDTVEVRKIDQKKYSYIAYYKPRGIITHSPTEEQKEIKDVLNRTDVFPIGRLDKDSEGLMILTNDGRLTDRLLNPDESHEKEYVVHVDKSIQTSVLRKFEKGIVIEGYKTKPAKAKIISEKIISITVTEGKKHQIRRMLAAVGYTVKQLKRTRIINVSLKNLKPNKFRELEGKEKDIFLQSVGL